MRKDDLVSITHRFLEMPNAPVEQADILVLPIPLERTVSFKPGTADAPAAILEISNQLEFYEEDRGWSPFKHLLISVLPEYVDDQSLAAADWHKGLTDFVTALPAENLFIGLGGEHSLTPALVAGRMPQPGTVIFLDAHADLRRSYEGSRFSHACPVTRLLAQGHRIIMGGIRSLFESEMEQIERESRITLFLDRDLQNPAQWASLLATINSLEGPVYLSIDMDAFDPAVAPGVGTPQPGGFSWYQVLEILDTLFACESVDLRGVDIVELVPEASRVAEMTATKLMMKIMSFWAYGKGYHRRPCQGSQMLIDYE
jgi:agmatinase